MKILPAFLLSVGLLHTAAMAEVEYAYVVSSMLQGYILHPQARDADFRESFRDFDPQKDGEPTHQATLGAPRHLAVRIDGKTYIVTVDNEYGVFTIYRATRRGNIWQRTQGAREIIHPELYERLRRDGLNIHTSEELRNMSRDRRRKALSGKDSPLRPTKTQK